MIESRLQNLRVTRLRKSAEKYATIFVVDSRVVKYPKYFFLTDTQHTYRTRVPYFIYYNIY